jgi:hypothetical protein
MQAFTPLPYEQQLRSESSLPKFMRRIKQQLDLYELSDYASLHQADDELPHASPADLSKRRKASALIKQSITDEVLDQFPDEYTGRQIVRALELRERRASSEYNSSNGPKTPASTQSPFSEKNTVATEGTFIASYASRFEPEYEMSVFRRPNVMRTLHPILPQQVAYVEDSRARQNSVGDNQGSALRDMQHSGSISQGPTLNVQRSNYFSLGSSLRDMQRSGSISKGTISDTQEKFDCKICSKSYGGSRQLERHIQKHMEPNKFRCPYEGCLKTAHRKDSIRSHVRTHEKRDKQSADSLKGFLYT